MNELINKIRNNKKIEYNGATYYHITFNTLKKHAENFKYYNIISFDNKHGNYAKNKLYIQLP